MLGILLVVIAGLASAAGLVLVNRDSDNVADEAQYVQADIPTTTPVFEPNNVGGNDPFYPLNVQLVDFQEQVETQLQMQVMEDMMTDDNSGDSDATGDETDAESSDDDVDDGVPTAGPPGDAPTVPVFDVEELEANVRTGLYGGTAENTCDPERLISFLYANPEIGEAWAKVQGIEFSQIADYIRSLEVRVLAADVNVLNHGYDPVTQAAYEIDSVLAAGTAVLVDEKGDVRTRCYCGNPIKPKPPENHMPPRCIVYGGYVFTVPGGTTKREDAPRDVLLTGNQTELEYGALWVEVKWGDSETERGWVRNDLLRKHYCPTPTTEYQCPGHDDVPVYANDFTTEVGQVTGTLNTTLGNQDIYGPIDPVGAPGDETIIGDHLLIHFTQASPSLQNSAWVRLSDLDNDDCFRIPECIDLTDTVRTRAGGPALDPALTGVLRVEFTGHFAAEFGSWTEVRVLDGTGRYGWVPTLGYTPLEDPRCEPPRWECVEGPAVVWETSVQPGPDFLGILFNATVQILDPVPQNGRIQIEMADGGPTGWVDQIHFNGGWDDCRPVLECYQLVGQAWTQYPNAGASIGPIATPTIFELHGKYVLEPLPGVLRIGFGGTEYWASLSDLIPLHPERCRPPQVECPRFPYGDLDRLRPVALREVTNPDRAVELLGSSDGDLGRPVNECCVTMLFNSTNVADVAPAHLAPAFVNVVGEAGVPNWFITSSGHFFRGLDIDPTGQACTPLCPSDILDGDILDDLDRLREVREIATLVDGTSAENEAGDEPALRLVRDIDEERRAIGADRTSGCCVNALFVGINIGDLGITQPQFVDVASGPHAGPGGPWFRTTDGTWFPLGAVTSADACTDISCPLVDDQLPEAVFVTEREALFSLSSPGDVERCCAQGDWYNMPSMDGGPAGTLAEPAEVIVTGVSEDGQWYQAIIDGDILGWLPASAFVGQHRCDSDDVGPGCPEFSLISLDEIGLEVCCVRVDNGGFMEVTLTGNARFVGPTLQLEDQDGVWHDIDAFVGDGRCGGDDAICPTGSLINTANPTECCVAVQGAQFEVVTLTGMTRVVDGVLEYEVEPGGIWYPAAQFADAERCDQGPVDPCPNGEIIAGVCCARGQEVFAGQCVDPCPEGQQRADNGRCFTPERPCDDRDQDGVCDTDDNCVSVPNGNQANSDGDRFGDACDNCRQVTNPDQADTNGNGLGDACDQPQDPCLFFGGDADGDGICNDRDNCVETPNADQADRDQDGFGDACDVPTDPCENLGGDFDGDGVCDERDNCVETPNPDQRDSDQNGAGDACDVPRDPCFDLGGDFDGDGVCDQVDDCVTTSSVPGDADKDGVPDECDNCPLEWNPDQTYPYPGNSCVPPSQTGPGGLQTVPNASVPLQVDPNLLPGLTVVTPTPEPLR